MTKLRTEQDRSLLSAAIAAVCAVMTAYSLRPVILYYQGSAGATAAVLTVAAGELALGTLGRIALNAVLDCAQGLLLREKRKMTSADRRKE